MQLSMCLSLLSACGGAEHAKNASQVVATVNDAEITETQLNQILQSAATEATPELTRQAVDTLIGEQLLLQEALTNKLDRDPRVLQALERAKRQVLAQAYAERKIYPKTVLSHADVEAYYYDNPVLFARHRTFQIDAFTVKQKDITAAVRTELDRVSSADQVRAELDRAGIKYETEHARVPAESLPIEQLKAFSAAKVGDLFLINQAANRLLIMVVTDIVENGISLESAQPRIEQYLINLRNKEAMEAYLKVAKAAASISYSDKLGISTRQESEP
ncbi:MAG: EpsD family peptidyl-prolyl cis-trans isomerase [Steroidobacteraceae bacterium]